MKNICVYVTHGIERRVIPASFAVCSSGRDGLLSQVCLYLLTLQIVIESIFLISCRYACVFVLNFSNPSIWHHPCCRVNRITDNLRRLSPMAAGRKATVRFCSYACFVSTLISASVNHVRSSGVLRGVSFLPRLPRQEP